MISRPDVHEVVRLDRLELTGWAYYAKGKARGSLHMMTRAEKLINAAHKRAITEVRDSADGIWIWPRKSGR